MKGKMAEKHHETMEKKEEHERHREKRADGGMLHNPIDDKDRGHKKERVTKKRGGRVHGEKPKERMDRRARGGGMNSDTSPFTAAAKMSEQDYEGDRVKGGTKAKGPDKGSAN